MKISYKIVDSKSTLWKYSVRKITTDESQPDRIKTDIVFSSDTLAECVAYITAKTNEWI